MTLYRHRGLLSITTIIDTRFTGRRIAQPGSRRGSRRRLGHQSAFLARRQRPVRPVMPPRVPVPGGAAVLHDPVLARRIDQRDTLPLLGVLPRMPRELAARVKYRSSVAANSFL